MFLYVFYLQINVFDIHHQHITSVAYLEILKGGVVIWVISDVHFQKCSNITSINFFISH